MWCPMEWSDVVSYGVVRCGVVIYVFRVYLTVHVLFTCIFVQYMYMYLTCIYLPVWYMYVHVLYLFSICMYQYMYVPYLPTCTCTVHVCILHVPVLAAKVILKL